MNNYKLTIQYDGTNYCGWQIQDNAITVQEVIKNSIEKILNTGITLNGSGRTDTGVHAFGQVANFLVEKELNLSKFIYSLNSVLPLEIAIKTIKKVNTDFHPRFDAVQRSYLYFINLSKNPFYYRYSLYLNNETIIDLTKLNTIAKHFIGEKDFTSFSKKNTEISNKTCTIYDIHFSKKNDFLVFYICANRFLHGMVRTIIGTILELNKRDFSINLLEDIFRDKNRESAGISVPAKGLFLYKVKYN